MISVIVTAYNRRSFLPLALESLLGQTIDKSKFEVIVVSNFDVNLKPFLAMDIRAIKTDGSLGHFLDYALRVSKGEIISFLDDDDIYLPNKLEFVERTFGGSDRVVYYRNAIIIKGETEFDYDRILTENTRQYQHMVPNSRIISVSDFASAKDIFAIFQHGGALNLSSISISRKCCEFLTRNLELNQMTIMPDLFFFLGILYSAERNDVMVFGNNILSIYRIHSSTSRVSKTADMDQFVQQMIKYCRLNIENHHLLKEKMSKDSISYKYLGLAIQGWKAQLKIMTSRKCSLQEIADLVRIGIYKKDVDVLGSALLALLSWWVLRKKITFFFLRIMRRRQSYY